MTMLKGSRLELRVVEKSHLAPLAEWFSQYELLRTMTPGAIRLNNMETEEAWFRGVCEGKNGHTFSMFALDAPEPRLLGTCSLFGVDGKNRSATLGIAIADPAARGQGYGHEALTLLLEFGFLELNLNRIDLWVFAFNKPAIRLYERLGFVLEGVKRQSVFREGRYWDEHLMSLLREEFSPRPIWNLE